MNEEKAQPSTHPLLGTRVEPLAEEEKGQVQEEEEAWKRCLKKQQVPRWETSPWLHVGKYKPLEEGHVQP